MAHFFEMGLDAFAEGLRLDVLEHILRQKLVHAHLSLQIFDVRFLIDGVLAQLLKEVPYLEAAQLNRSILINVYSASVVVVSYLESIEQICSTTPSVLLI